MPKPKTPDPLPELYRRHRPGDFAGVAGNPDAVRLCETWLATAGVPHAVLFTGPSGTGKTTMARILRTAMGCSDADFSEVNCADFRGIDSVRDIRTRCGLKPMSGGKVRVWLIDEAHQLTKDAQTAFLKLLEDPPAHAYFMLATTDPGKLLPTVRTRCAEVRLKPLSDKTLSGLLAAVAAAEGVTGLDGEFLDRVCQVSDGSARKALVVLQSVLAIKDPDERLQAVLSSDTVQDAINLARAMVEPRPSWAKVSAVLKGVKDDPEGVRRLVLAYCGTVLLGGGKLAPRAAAVLNAFRDPLYDLGRPGLILFAYEACRQ